MSCNEWEQGTIKIPSKIWSVTKKRIRDAYNEWIDSELAAAKDFYNRFKGCKKPKYGESGYERWDDGENRFNCLFIHPTKKTDRGWVVRLDSPRSPRRIDFPRATNRTDSFNPNGEEFGFGFDNDKRQVGWSVGENNRSCDRAHEHVLTRRLFSILRSIEYTRATGGQVVGNDEYNQEDRYEGGGSNYVKQRFGPLGDSPILAGIRY